jgi:uncharacterized membrane protein YebE (DUF533 family)
MNLQSLLGALLQSDPASSTQNRMQHAMGPEGLAGAGNPLAGLFGDLTQKAGGFYETGRQRVESGDPLAIGGLGALAGLLLGGRGGALGGGALAMLGSLAYSAMKKASGETGQVTAEQVAQEAPLGLRAASTPAEQRALESKAQLVIRAMVSAAKSDGAIDEREQQRLLGKVRENGADQEDQAFLMEELKRPPDVDALIRDVKASGAEVETYAASMLAIDVDTPAEVAYLARLAAGLGLSPQVVQEIHSALGVKV